MTSGLARRNPFLVRCMADVLGHDVEVPIVDEPTAVGAAIHGAVAAGTVRDYAEGARRFGAKRFERVSFDAGRHAAYAPLYEHYLALSGSDAVRDAMHALRGIEPAS